MGWVERFTEIPHRLRSAAPFNGSTIKRRILAITIVLRNGDSNLGSSGESVGSTTALDGNSDANETETTESTVRARLDSKSL